MDVAEDSAAAAAAAADASGAAPAEPAEPAAPAVDDSAASASQAAAAENGAAATPAAGPSTRPVACIILGMAGAGKTTLMQRLNAHLHEEQTPYYLVNLDPAVLDTPFGANIDIRDTVNYKEVMRQYQLGPNGGILTSLNLFATRFEEVLSLVKTRCESPTPPRYVMLDTPGQIEIFTWSASGAIITEALASAMPTVRRAAPPMPCCVAWRVARESQCARRWWCTWSTRRALRTR